MTFTALHSSSHGSDSVASLKKALDLFVTKAGVIWMTELGGARSHALHMFPGHTAITGKHGDAAQLGGLWNNTVWTVLDSYEAQLTPQQYTRAGGALAPANDTLVTFARENVSGLTLLVLQVHLPAHVEGHSGPGGIWLDYFRSAVYRSALKGLQAEKKRAIKKYQPDAVIIDGDFNENIERLDVRAFFKAMWPHFTPNWTTFNSVGTLGKRFIDILFLKHLRVVKKGLPQHTASSDHRWYVDELEFVLAKVRKKPNKKQPKAFLRTA